MANDVAAEVAVKLAEAKKKMFGDMQPSGGKIVLLVRGDATVTADKNKVIVRKG